MERFDPFEQIENMTEVFRYHAPSADQLESYTAVRRAALTFALVLREHVPHCADRTAALRKLREAVMTANAAIALKGKI